MAQPEGGRASANAQGDAPWLRAAHFFIPAALRADPEEYRRARTAVYMCALPLLMSFAYLWYYTRVLSGDARLWVCGTMVGTQLAGVAALFTLRATGRVGLAMNVLLGYSFAAFAWVAWLLGGPASTTTYWLLMVPLVAALTGGTRPALGWLALCLAEYAVSYWLLVRGIPSPNYLPREQQGAVWLASLSCITLICLFSVMIYERAKTGTLRTLLAANAELELARDAALAADHSKADFLAKVSNEIRTPLTAILGFAELLLREAEKGGVPRESEATLLTIRRNGENLLEIINDILDQSRIASGRVDVERVEFAPMALISDVVALMTLRARAKGLRLSVECGPELPETIENDERRLRQVLVNLLGNALKFTDAGRVVLRAATRASERGPVLRFEVQDQGIGISPEQMARLFQPFAQADASTARRYGGTGLGLSICKHLVELLDGRIGAESRLGEGSLFWVELPLAPAEKQGGDG